MLGNSLILCVLTLGLKYMIRSKNIIASLCVGVGVLALSTSQTFANTWLDLDEDEGYLARHECSFVQAGNQFYIFGGRESPQQLDAYDYEQDEWTNGASAPIPFNHFQATEYQGLIWVIGAFRNNSFPNETPADFVYTYDPANDVWFQGPEIPEDRRRGSTGLVEYQGKFYVVGGNTIGHNGGYVSWFDVFDPETGSWTPLADAPNARDHFHATVVDDKLYVAGGRLSGGPGGTFAPLIEAVDVFDFTSGTWSSLPASSNLPTPRAAASVVTFQGNVMVIGGEGNGKAYDTVEQYNPNSKLWTELPSLNHARHGTQALVSGEGVFTAAGSPNQGGGRQRNMEAFNSSIPVGEVNTAGALESAIDELLINSSEAQEIELRHISGNQGVMVTEVELIGGNASSFAITDRPTLPALVPVNDSKTILVRALNETNGEFSSLNVTYNNGQTLSVPIRYEQNTPIQTPAVNLLVNGSFEDANLNGRSFRITSAFGGWQKNGNGAAEFWSSGFLGTPAQDGNVLTELDVGRNTVDSLSQDVITVPGQNYDLSFYLRARGASNTSNQLSVLWNNIEVSTFAGGTDWNQETLQLVGTGFDRLTLAETNAANDGLGTHIDNVSLVAAIEPVAELPLINLSEGQSVEQINTRFNGVASRAVDGNTSGIYRDRSVTHTSNTNQPWWQVDLGVQANIASVKVFNRSDNCCIDRLSNFYVLVSSKPFANKSLTELLNDPTIENSFHESLSSDTIEIAVNNIQGRYVRVQLRDAGILSLAEVEVMGSVK